MTGEFAPRLFTPAPKRRGKRIAASRLAPVRDDDGLSAEEIADSLAAAGRRGVAAAVEEVQAAGRERYALRDGRLIRIAPDGSIRPADD